MKAETVLAITAIAAGVYLVWKMNEGDEWNRDTGSQALLNAGLDVFPSHIASDAGKKVTFARGGNTLFRFPEADFNKLNFAQKRLIEIDKYVPGTWLTKLTLR